MEFYTKLAIIGYGLIIMCMIIELIFTKKINSVDKLFNIKNQILYYFAIIIYILFACIAINCIIYLLKLKNYRTLAIILSYMMLIAGLMVLIGSCILFIGLYYKNKNL